ncbi:ferric reductase like transmembrane component-domain-containing protein [Cryomyces antarcticus]
MPLWALLAIATRIVVAAGGGEASSPAAIAAAEAANLENIRISYYLGWIWAAIIGALLSYRLTLAGIRYIRTIACLNNEEQRYFAAPSETCSKIKKHIIDAPLFRKRHHREFNLSAAINMGTLPSRFQTLFLAGYLGMNVAFCVISIDWSGKQAAVLTELRNRTGVLAVVNMMPLFILAGRNNPLIRLLDISFDTYNLVHRWIGRIVVLEAITHTLAWTISKVNTAGWSAVGKSMASSQLIMTGTVGVAAFLGLLCHSPSPIRHAFYEAFLHVHIALATLAVIAVWVHLKTLPQQSILLAVIVFWIVERLTRIYTIVRHNVGNGGTTAEIEALPGDAVRVTLKLARPWRFQPGQHIFLYIPSIGLWTSHPFSLAWSEEEDSLNPEKSIALTQQDVLARRKTAMSLIVRRRTGFTEKLYKRADASPGGKFTVSALVEGPYGSQSLDSYGTVLLFAAGVGITHQVPHVRALVAGYASSTIATRRIVLVWIIQSPEHLEWIRPWMTSILGMEKRREALKILLFVTRPRSTTEIHSPSASVQMFPGKPNVRALVEAEAERQVGAMAVSVCGTGGLSDEVRRAARGVGEGRSVEFVENAFSW